MRGEVAGIATAPVSYGVFGGADVRELAVSPTGLLAAMSEAGYAGSELGPPGFFGTPDETAAAFADHGLTVVGAYVPLHLSLPDAVLQRDMEAMRNTLEELCASDNPAALAILADEGDDQLIRHPFRDPGDRSRGMSRDQWSRAADRIAAAGELAASYGVRTTFHPHFATYVEQAWEIDTLLELTDVGLCLDSGHFHLGGAEPAEYLRRWISRINHVHVKDARDAVVSGARARGDEDFESWWEALCCPLGEGDVDVEEFVTAIKETGYTGWLVVEQDRGPATADAWSSVVADQRANREWLASRVRAAATR